MIRAIFRGPRESLGYVPGQTYVLELRTNARGDKPKIYRPYPCPYGSWSAFWANWEQVREPAAPGAVPLNREDELTYALSFLVTEVEPALMYLDPDKVNVEVLRSAVKTAREMVGE